MSFRQDMRRLARAAEQAGRPAPPPDDEIDEDADVIAVLMTRGQAVKVKGGPGSGHFRHRGRPGRVRGSTPSGRAVERTGQPPGAGEEPVAGVPGAAEPTTEPGAAAEPEVRPFPPERQAAQAATLAIRDAVEEEPAITELVQRLTKEHGGVNWGLEHRIKKHSSLVRKILDDMEEKQLDTLAAADRINDVVRYTTIFDPDVYSKRVLAIQAAMEAAGWRQFNRKFKNFWHPGGDYSGYHAIFTNDDGYTFEWQFHTPESIGIKEESWQIYNRIREMEEGPEQRRLYDQMVGLWKRLKKIPKDYETLPGLAL
jgi:hypothetical protein